ncbi:glycosyltransferase family 1 protein [Roseiconus lacunae]|uniref:glycosyltransferase family 4 protein n=1 Tax=Roseiconus lacunae TaxID=2605694 RepID=UPI0030860781|nr:glycosyltransferase family 1 protein [Stieleria sp. HD01]
MRIAFWLLQDSIRQWAGWVAGLHYVRNCLEGLASLPDDEAPEVVAFVPSSLHEKLVDDAGFDDRPWFRVHLIEDDLLQDLDRRNELMSRVANEHCDVLFPAITPPVVPFKGKCVGWITDLQHKHYPEFFSDAELRHRDELFSFLSASCNRIVCSSASVQADMQQFFPEAEDRTYVLRFRTLPPASATDADPTDVMRQLQIDEPYVYLPYQFWQHKNHRVVFEAWHLINQQMTEQQGRTPLLVCSGATIDGRNPDHVPGLERFIREHQLDDRIRILGMVPREQQWQLYRNANLIVQPSLFEGWSTSVEEARTLGKQVLLSDIPVHREQADSPEQLFPPHDPELLAKMVRQAMKASKPGIDIERECDAKAESIERMQRFGRDLVQLFQETHDEPRRPVTNGVLPLLLSAQHEASKRLEVIEHLQRKLAAVEQGADHRPRRRWFRRDKRATRT